MCTLHRGIHGGALYCLLYGTVCLVSEKCSNIVLRCVSFLWLILVRSCQADTKFHSSWPLSGSAVRNYSCLSSASRSLLFSRPDRTPGLYRAVFTGGGAYCSVSARPSRAAVFTYSLRSDGEHAFSASQYHCEPHLVPRTPTISAKIWSVYLCADAPSRVWLRFTSRMHYERT